MIVGLFRPSHETETLHQLLFQLSGPLVNLLVGIFFSNAILLLDFARQNVATASDLQEFVIR
jgi:hypothetical protein